MEKIKIDKFHLTLINLQSLLPDIEYKIADDVYKYKLSIEKGSKDVRCLIYHHLILDMCNAVKGTDTIYKAISYHKDVTFLSDYMDIESGRLFFLKTMKKLNNLLPINIWESPYEFKTMSKLMDSTGGERIELEYHLNKLTDTRKKSLYSFNKIKKFGSKYGLQFLTKNFFEKIENKQLIIS